MNKKVRTISIYCNNCHSYLFKYHKGGRGGLVKCFESKVLRDETGGNLFCQNCKQNYARKIEIRGNPARKIIQGKVIVKGMSRR